MSKIMANNNNFDLNLYDDDPGRHVFPCIENPFRVTLKCNGYYVYCVNSNTGKLATRKTRGNERDEFQIIQKQQQQQQQQQTQNGIVDGGDTTNNNGAKTTTRDDSNNRDTKVDYGSVRLRNYKFGTFLSVIMMDDINNKSSIKKKIETDVTDGDGDGADSSRKKQQQQQQRLQRRNLQCVKIESDVKQQHQQQNQKLYHKEENDDDDESQEKASNNKTSDEDEDKNGSDHPAVPSPTTTIPNPQQADTEEEEEEEEDEAGQEEMHSLLQEEKEKRERIFKTIVEEGGNNGGGDIGGGQSSSTTDDDDGDDDILNDNVNSDWIWIEASNGKVLIKNCQTADSLGIDDSGNLMLVDSVNEDPENPQCLWNVETVTGELLFMSNVSLVSSSSPSPSASSPSSLFPIIKNLQLRCDISGRLSLVENCKGWEVFRFMESSCGHGYIRISSWMHHQWILACNNNGIVQMQKIDSNDYNSTAVETVDVNNKNNKNISDGNNDCWCVHWAVEKAPNGKGVVIRSKKHGRFLNVDTSNNANLLSTYHPFDESTREFAAKDNNKIATSTTTDDDDVVDDEILHYQHQGQDQTTTSNHKDGDIIDRKIIPSKAEMKNADFLQEKQAKGETVVSQDYFLHNAMANKTTATPSPSSRRRWFRRGQAPSSPDLPPTAETSSSSISRVVVEDPTATSPAGTKTTDKTTAITSRSLIYRVPPKDTIVWNLHPAHLQQYNFYNAPPSPTTTASTQASVDTNENATKKRKDDHEDSASHQQLSIGPFPQVSSNLRRTDKFQLIRTTATAGVAAANTTIEDGNKKIDDEIIVTRLFHLETRKLVACSSDGKIFLKEEEEEEKPQRHEEDNDNVDNDDHDEDDKNNNCVEGSHDSSQGHSLDETEWIMERASCGGSIFQSRAYPEYYLSHGTVACVDGTSCKRMTSSSSSTDGTSEDVRVTDEPVMDMGLSDNCESSDTGIDISIEEPVDKTTVDDSTSKEDKSAEHLIDASIEETVDRNTADTPSSSGPVRNFFRRRRQQQAANDDGKQAANGEHRVEMNEGEDESVGAAKSDKVDTLVDVSGEEPETGEAVDKKDETATTSSGPVRDFFRRRRQQQAVNEEPVVDIGKSEDEAAATVPTDTEKSADDSAAAAPAPTTLDGPVDASNEEAETEEAVAEKVDPTSSSGPVRNFFRRRRQQHAVNEESAVELDKNAKESSSSAVDGSLNASNEEGELGEAADNMIDPPPPPSGPVRNFLRRRRQKQEQRRSSTDADTSESVENSIVPAGKTELVASKTIGEREKWVLHPVMPRAINSGKIKTFAIGTSLVVGSSLAMPFAMAGAGALLGAAGAHIGVVGHVVMAGLSSFDALSSVGTVGATAYLVFRPQANALTDDHQTDKDKEVERAWSKRPFSNWKNW